MTREQVEAVLRKHLASEVHDNLLVKLANTVMTPLVDDLLALYPQPSKEALVDIYRKHGHSVGGESASFFDNLLAWACGEPQTWCEHLAYRSISEDEYDRPSGWYATGKDWCFFCARDFKFCPLWRGV